MYFNFKGWKKVSTDKKCVVMQNHEGHELKISLSSLTPKMRGRLAELETAKDEEGKPQSMAMGGVVMETGNKADDAEQKRRRDATPVESGTQETKGRTVHPKHKQETLGEAIGYKGMAAGGQVEDTKKKTLGSTIGYPGFYDGGQATDLDAKRMAYNRELAMNQPLNPNTGEPMEASGEMFSKAPSDSLPYTIDPKAWQSASNKVDTVKEMGAESAKADATQQAQSIMAQNQARQQAGLPLLPTAEQPIAQGPTPASVPPSAGIAPTQAPQAATDAASQSVGMPTAEQLLAQGYQSQISGVNALASAEAKLGEAKQKALIDSQAYQQSAAKDFQNKTAELDNENKALIADYKAGHIDPNHFWDNKSTVGKVSTAIGLILGGIGQGLMGKGSNSALDFMQKQIDADIDAQKANISKGHNLLSFNMQRFGNLKDAAEMTRAQQMAMTANMLDQAAAVAQGPEAKARALMASGELKAKYAPIIQKQALESTITKLKGEVAKDPSKAGLLFDTVAKVDPEKAKDLRDRYIPGLGFANTGADAKDLKEAKAATDVINTGIKRLIDINKISGKSMDPSLIAEANAITTGLKGPFRTALGLGTLSEGDMKLLDNLLRNPTNFFSLASSNKRALETVVKRTNENFALAAKSKGLTAPDAASNLSAQDQRIAATARANLNNPKHSAAARAALKRLGLDE